MDNNEKLEKDLQFMQTLIGNCIPATWADKLGDSYIDRELCAMVRLFSWDDIHKYVGDGSYEHYKICYALMQREHEKIGDNSIPKMPENEYKWALNRIKQLRDEYNYDLNMANRCFA